MRRVPALALCMLAATATMSGCFEPVGNGWAAEATQLDQLRGTKLAGQAVRIAVLDSGLDLGHPSLAHLDDGRRLNGELVGYVDFLGGSGGPKDRGGHGTFVAGILAARPPDGLASVTASSSALRGLVPDLELLVGRVCNRDDCNLVALWKGLEWAIANDADVIGLSLGYTSEALADRSFVLDRIQGTLRDAEAKGILVVAAAGNTAGAVLFPAREPTVLAVGAMDRDGTTRASTARGFGSLKPDLVAPGQDIVGPDQGSGRVSRHGTSAAVPFVVAAAALLMAAAHDPSDAEGLAMLRQALLGTAAPLEGQQVPHDPWAGHGLVQAEDALASYARMPWVPSA